MKKNGRNLLTWWLAWTLALYFAVPAQHAIAHGQVPIPTVALHDQAEAYAHGEHPVDHAGHHHGHHTPKMSGLGDSGSECPECDDKACNFCPQCHIAPPALGLNGPPRLDAFPAEAAVRHPDHPPGVDLRPPRTLHS